MPLAQRWCRAVSGATCSQNLEMPAPCAPKLSLQPQSSRHYVRARAILYIYICMYIHIYIYIVTSSPDGNTMQLGWTCCAACEDAPPPGDSAEQGKAFARKRGFATEEEGADLQDVDYGRAVEAIDLPSLPVLPLTSTTSSRPGKRSRLEQLRHLEVDEEIMRGIPLQKTLWHLGVLWRKSPLALSPEARTGLWKMSAPASTFDIFLSHTWHTPGKWKILSLFFQSGWRFSFLGWFVGASLMLLASTHKLLPLFIPYRSNFDGATISCGPWCLCGTLL